MNKQETFNYKFEINKNDIDFYVNETNKNSFDVISNDINNIFLVGPNKSGKTILGQLWKKNNNAIIFQNNFEYLLKNKRNILIDEFNINISEEKLFHLINHANNENCKILIISKYDLYEYNFKTKDLLSRLKTFTYSKINNPDDDMLINILTKLFTQKQFIIHSVEIFDYILRRTNRTYENIFFIVDKLDKLSLEKKRQLTIPLIKEIL